MIYHLEYILCTDFISDVIIRKSNEDRRRLNRSDTDQENLRQERTGGDYLDSTEVLHKEKKSVC